MKLGKFTVSEVQNIGSVAYSVKACAHMCTDGQLDSYAAVL